MAHFLVMAGMGYVAIGGAVAAWFLLWRIDRIDPAAVGAFAFRPLLVPGVVLLWPIVVLKS